MATAPRPDPLDEDVAGLRRAYASGVDPVEVVDQVLARIERDGDPAIWIAVEPAAELRRAARRLATLDSTLPLWGVPFAVKDNIDVEGRPTTAGLPGRTAPAERTATVVQRLLAAGGLYVGKTNLDQLATGLVGTRSPFGIPVNPIDADLAPGGSSSGSAVAVARRQVTFALGTDTAGSGRVPAALCGVVGCKAAPGQRPTDGVLPASPSIDCVSTFARSVADALLVDGVLGARAWPVATGPFRVAVAGAPEAAASLAAGAHEVSDVDLAPFHEAGDLLYGGPWVADRIAALDPIVAAHPDDVTDIVRRVLEPGRAYTGADVFRAIARLGAIRAELAPWWDEVDALVVPTVEIVPTVAEVAADPLGVNVRLGRNTTFANLLGLTAVTVPAPSGPGGVTVLAPPSHAGAVAAIAAELHGEHLPAGPAGPRGHHHLAVVGAHLRGQPLNHELTDRGAVLVARTHTAPSYRLYRLDGGPPLRPGLDRVGAGGASIEVEVWELDDAGLGAVTAGVAPPLGIGSVELLDGRWVKGFVCEPHGLADATDITGFGGWRAYLTFQAQAVDATAR